MLIFEPTNTAKKQKSNVTVLFIKVHFTKTCPYQLSLCETGSTEHQA